MKRFLVTLFVLLSVTAVCQARRTPGKSDIQAMVNDMRAEARLAGISSDKESVSLPGIKVVSDANVEMVSIGGIAMKLGKSFSGLNREMPAVRGISSMLVVSYEDCPVHIKDKFNAKMSNALRGCELLMEAKDNGEKMSIYGNTARDGERVNDIIMFVPQEGALICFFGSIDSKDLAYLVESTTK